MLKYLLGTFAAVAIIIVIILSNASVTPSILINSMFGTGIDTPASETIQAKLKLPHGFSIGVYAANVANARMLEFSEEGDLIVAQPREGKVTLLTRDANSDGVSDGRRVLLENLNRPHSIDFHDGYLYVAESTAIGRIRFNQLMGTTTGEYEQIITGLGDVGNHWSKTIRFGPDGLLYLSSGSTCNVCLEDDERRASITRYQPDGTGEERFATGLRNSVGFDWSPADGQLYATDNGRDLLGDDFPPCELNKIEMGKFYGWPYINGFGDLDPGFGDETKIALTTQPVHGFKAHNAPLGMRFINNQAWPEEFGGAALVALHGSWNRSTFDGYKVVSLQPNEASDGFIERDFISGFEQDGDIIGRPVDIALGLDDCAYISDDYAMAIYRVCYGETQQDEAISIAQENHTTGLENIPAAELAELQGKGEQLFRTRGCLACHIISDSKAVFGLKPLNNLSAKHSIESLAAFFKTPTPPMPPVRLSDPAEELALSVYLLSN